MSNYALDVVKGFYYYAKDGFQGFASDYQQNADKQTESLSAFLEAGYLEPDRAKTTAGKVLKTAGVAVQKAGAGIATIPLMGANIVAHPIESAKGIADTLLVNPAKSVYTAGSLLFTNNATEGIKETMKETSLKDVGKFAGDATVLLAGGAVAIKSLQVAHAAQISTASAQATAAATAKTVMQEAASTVKQTAKRSRPRIKTIAYKTDNGSFTFKTYKNREGIFLQKRTDYNAEGVRTKCTVSGFNGKEHVCEQRFFNANGSLSRVHKNDHISNRTYRIERYGANNKMEIAENYTEDGLKLRSVETYGENGCTIFTVKK